jgi:hypothetical protein
MRLECLCWVELLDLQRRSFGILTPTGHCKENGCAGAADIAASRNVQQRADLSCHGL